MDCVGTVWVILNALCQTTILFYIQIFVVFVGIYKRIPTIGFVKENCNSEYILSIVCCNGSNGSFTTSKVTSKHCEFIRNNTN